MAGAATLAMFFGFAPTYFLKNLYGAPALSPLTHLHAALFTTWPLLFCAQVTLVSVRRTDVHRRFGRAAGVLLIALLTVGVVFSIGATRVHRFEPPVPGLLPPLQFLIVPLTDLALFGTLVAAGLLTRRTPDTHKRLMLLGTIALLHGSFVRLGLPGHVLAFLGLPPGQRTGFAFTVVFVAVCLLYDRISRGRVQPAFMWGSTLIVATQMVRVVIGGTTAWLGLADWLTR